MASIVQATKAKGTRGGCITTKTFMFWPNATVPFYINPDHFDQEHATAIMTSLSMFAFKTCLKFAPLMTAPSEGQHVMTFVNPDGIKRCRINLKPHSNYHPHIVFVGYECLKTSEIDMLIMRALGLPFEHNRMSRDVFIDVMVENIEPSYMHLFTKDSLLPGLLRALPYDQNSVMHFGERDYSKNGHRTIVFKNRNFRQNKNGLTDTDIKKIETIYGAECRARDRAEKVAVCQSYPGVSRRKREIVEPPANKSLRVNPNITPPAHLLAKLAEGDTIPDNYPEIKIDVETENNKSLDTLRIVKETNKIIEQVYELSELALKNAREKYCNSTSLFEYYEKVGKKDKTSAPDVLGIYKIILEFARTIINDAAGDVGEFCQNSMSIEKYQSKRKLENVTRCFRPYESQKWWHTTELKHVDKAQKTHILVDNVDDKKRTPDDNVTTTTLKLNRRKRETTNTVTTPKPTMESKGKIAKKETETNEEGKKATNLKETLKSLRKDRLVKIQIETTRKSELKSSTTDPKARRIFSDKRFQVQNRNNEELEESDTSLDKNTNTEPGKTLNNNELLVKVLTQGAKSVLAPMNENKAVETTEEKADGGNIDKEEKTAENTDMDEGHDGTEKEEEDTVETTVETTTQSRIIYKNSKKEVSEESDLTDVEVKPLKKKNHKKNRSDKERREPEIVELNKLNKEFYNERRWPDGVIIYVIANLPDYDLEDVRKRLADVNRILKKKTCVKLREVDAKEAPGFDDYMILDDSPDFVTGRVGGKQNFGCIELFEGGYHKQHTAMVVMAMLGFYFEVSRHDRDQHIRVHNRHIRPDKLHHFEKIRAEATLNLPYDYNSATHPAWQFWRKPGKKGISTVATYKKQDPDGSVMRELGQHPNLLSQYDIIKINSVYGIECFQSNRASNKEEEKDSMKGEDVLQ